MKQVENRRVEDRFETERTPRPRLSRQDENTRADHRAHAERGEAPGPKVSSSAAFRAPPDAAMSASMLFVPKS